MVLSVSRPWKHPDSGIFYLRRAVPAALKPVLGKTMEKVSLGTRDPVEARIRHAELLADLELRWLALKKGTVKLSHKQIVAIAGELYRSLIDEHADEPGKSSSWRLELLHDLAYLEPEKAKISIVTSPTSRRSRAKPTMLCPDRAGRMRDGRSLELPIGIPPHAVSLPWAA